MRHCRLEEPRTRIYVTTNDILEVLVAAHELVRLLVDEGVDGAVGHLRDALLGQERVDGWRWLDGLV